MRMDVLTLFPDMFDGPMTQSMIGKARENKKIDFHTLDFRQFANNKHNHVDDYPFGGGAGMLLKVEPIDLALQQLEQEVPHTKKRIILMDPSGKPFTQKIAEEFAEEEHLVFICGHYEGYDERIRHYVTDEYSIGDFVLTGGEIPAMSIIDSVTRLVPGVISEESLTSESFTDNLLDYPVYTKPQVFRGMKVPDVLMSGDHRKIEEWRMDQSMARTKERRPDLFEND